MNKELQIFISKIRQLEHQATPAPWSQYGNSIEDARKIPLVTLTKEHFDDRNAEFITALRNAMPRLLQVIEQQDREIMRLKGEDLGAVGSAGPASSSLMQ
jgi:hypothetical protein